MAGRKAKFGSKANTLRTMFILPKKSNKIKLYKKIVNEKIKEIWETDEENPNRIEKISNF